MERTQLSVGTTKHGFNDADGFELIGYSPSSASSFSSGCSFGPFKPASGRSTPPGLDMDASFVSVDPFSFDLTPPSSVMSTNGYFQMDMKNDDPCGFYRPRLLATLSRDPVDLSSLSYENDTTTHTPSQPMDFCTFANALGPSPSPLTPVRSNHMSNSWNAWNMWQQPESPLCDDEQSVPFQQPPTAKQLRKTSASLVVDEQSCRRLFDTAKEQTAELQEAQPQLATWPRSRTTKKEVSHMILGDGVEVDVVSSNSMHPCHWKNDEGHQCRNKFQKKEHLVRHIKAAHMGINHPCQFCPRLFNRTDNRWSHEWLHAEIRKQGRVKYIPGAKEILQEQAKKRRRTVQATKRKSRARARRRCTIQYTRRSNIVLDESSGRHCITK